MIIEKLNIKNIYFLNISNHLVKFKMYISFEFIEHDWTGLFYRDPEAYTAIIKNRVVEGLSGYAVAHNHLDLEDIRVLGEGRVEIKAVAVLEIHDCMVLNELLVRALH